MVTKNNIVVPFGISEKDISKRIKEITQNELLVFYVREGMSPNTGGPLGGGAITVELNPDYKPRTTNHKYKCMTFNIDEELIVGEPDIIFFVDSEQDLADRLYWRQIEL